MIEIFRQPPQLVWKKEGLILVAYLGTIRKLEIDNYNRIIFGSMTTKPYPSQNAAIKAAETLIA